MRGPHLTPMQKDVLNVVGSFVLVVAMFVAIGLWLIPE